VRLDREDDVIVQRVDRAEKREVSPPGGDGMRPVLISDPDAILTCLHSRQSGALRLDAIRTLVAFTVCDECGAVVSPLPEHTAEARSLMRHRPLIIADEA
jgi:hypothetical protein